MPYFRLKIYSITKIQAVQCPLENTRRPLQNSVFKGIALHSKHQVTLLAPLFHGTGRPKWRKSYTTY